MTPISIAFAERPREASAVQLGEAKPVIPRKRGDQDLSMTQSTTTRIGDTHRLTQTNERSTPDEKDGVSASATPDFRLDPLAPVRTSPQTIKRRAG